MTRVLWWSDYACSTGFGMVASNLARLLVKNNPDIQLDVLGVNYSGDPYDTERWPGKVYPAKSGIMAGPAYKDVWGSQRLLDLLEQTDYDLVFILQDPKTVLKVLPALLQMQRVNRRKFRTVYYFPLDAPPYEEWIYKVIANVDFPVTYTNYAKSEIAKIAPKVADKVEVIYHGTNTSDFHPLPAGDIKAFRQAINTADKFMIANINRNQPRKDIARSLMVLKELKKRGHEDILLYLHMATFDYDTDLLKLIDYMGLKLHSDVEFPNQHIYDDNQGMPLEALNLLYNAADCLLTTSLGEGWGLSVTEAMAVKTPIVAPNHTSLSEILAKGRGYTVKTGANPSMWTMIYDDESRLRPLMDVTEAADKIELIKEGKLPDVEAAYRWATKYTWEAIWPQWQSVFDKSLLAVERNL